MIAPLITKEREIAKNECVEKDKFVAPLPNDVKPIPKGMDCVVNELAKLEMVSDSIESFQKGKPMPFMPSAIGVKAFDIAQSAEKKRINAFLDERQKENFERGVITLTGAVLVAGILKLLP